MRGNVHLVVIDNYDSFTYNLVQYLQVLGAECEIHLNDRSTASAVLDRSPAGVVISPGPGTPEQAGVTLEVIAAASGRIPILGVCLGHQAVAYHFGANVVRAAVPMHGKTDRIVHDGAGLFHGLPCPLVAARYHSLVVEESTVPACLQVTARSSDRAVMALQHERWPIHTLQFHPESILSQHGTALLRNWLEGL